jgi:mono/diheme cytochrome c family protein
MLKPGRWGSFLLGIAAGLLLAVIALAMLGWSAFRDGFSARARPTALENTLASAMLHASVSSRNGELQPSMATTRQMLAEGMEHYADHCANCHANNGSGDTMYGRGLNPRPPDLRLPATQNKSDGELYSIIQNGVRMSGMPAFGEPGAHDHSSWELVAFLRHLPSLTPDEELSMQHMNPITPSEMKEQQAEDDFLNGSPATKTSTPKGHQP